MKREKHEKIMAEVWDEVNTALSDKRGLIAHQSRLAFSVSLGAVNILEIYLHNLNVLKEGVKIDHKWFKRKMETVFEHLQNQITSPIISIQRIEEIVDIVRKIEEKRDDLAYGSSATEEVLQEKINLLFKLKEITKC